MKKSKQTKPVKLVVPVPAEVAGDDLSIVAIGASAGGIEAFTELARNLSTDTGMSFLFIQHLDPTHDSILTELVSKETKMPVREVTNGLQVAPNHVYMIPPNTKMSISGNTLELTRREDSRGAHMSIDYFMRSLAEAQGNRSIGVILSGSESDGTLGLAEIQAQGGVTFAQEEASARYDGMPHSAIAAGCVDYILPPKAIARELSRIAKHPFVIRPDAASVSQLATAGEARLDTIFQLLRRTTGVDFTHYRQTTILRRIQRRRMLVHKLEKLSEYMFVVPLRRTAGRVPVAGSLRGGRVGDEPFRPGGSDAQDLFKEGYGRPPSGEFFSESTERTNRARHIASTDYARGRQLELCRASERIRSPLVDSVLAATAFVNEDLEVIHTHGNVNRYLKLAPGRARVSIS
jgi:CheB methylesterase/CheR methyltransferase, all-alpha domain